MATRQSVTSDLALLTMDLLSARRRERRREAALGRAEEWLDSVAARACGAVGPSEGAVVIPSYCRDVTVRFEDPVVRKKMMKLMNTDVVKIMDKEFMYKLQNRLYESYWEAFQERLAKRREWEVERRRHLALEGIQAVDDPFVKHHPVTEVKREVERELAIIREKEKRPYVTKPRLFWDYQQFNTESEHESVKSESAEEEKEDVHLQELERKKNELELSFMKNQSLTNFKSKEFYQRIKYEPPLIKELKAANTVDDLYSIAEKILDQKVHYVPLTEDMIKTGLKVPPQDQPPQQDV